MTTITDTKSGSRNLVGPIILAVLVIAGIYAWTVQLTKGFDVVGIGQEIVWGIYIAAFFLLLGTGCALVLFAAAGDLGLLPGIQMQQRTLLTFALGMFVAGGIAILMDIGKPTRVLNLLTSPQWMSPFIWDFFGLVITVVVTLVYLFARSKGRILPWVAGIMAAAIIIVEGLILGVLASRPLWHGGLIPVLFFLEAMTAGSAFMLLVLPVHQAWTRKALTYLLVITGLVLLVDALALLFSGPTAARDALTLMLSGNLAVWFWTQILLGIVLPVILLLVAPTRRVAVIFAGVLAILGVLLSKLTLLTAGQAVPLLGPADTYIPTLVELGGVLGVLAFALLLGYIGLRIIPDKVMK